MSEQKKPSVKRISEITGFSPATVSNALNMKRGVKRETAERVFQVAEELGYTMGSKSLKSIKFVKFRRTGEIIDENPFHVNLIEGVEAAAKENGLSTIYIRLERGDSDYEEQVARIVNDANTGVILLATEMLEEDFLPFRDCKCPLVLLDGWNSKLFFDSVLINNLDSAANAVGYLIEKGHREIGYIRGDFRIQAFQTREIGFHQMLLNCGLKDHPEWTVTVGSTTETAYTRMLAWLDQGIRLPSAFFVDNDLIAYGVLRALKQRGIQVPEDLSIIGFDDLPYSAVSVPTLTTVRVHRHSMGREAVRHLLNVMDHPGDSKYKVESCTELVERESVADGFTAME